MDRQYYGQKKKKDKRTNNNLQNIIQKTKDWATRIRWKTEDGLGCFSSCSTSGNRHVTLVKNPVINYESENDQIV